MTPLHLISLKNVPIAEQLALEERLLREDDRNFCLTNIGSPRTIVMGISGNPDLLIDQEKAVQDQIPILRRFSGGGTVIVDEETLFITFIFSKKTFDWPAFPETILRWTASLYQAAWNIPGFALLENDYVIKDKKCGGNAQYIRKERWLHHTSFLWNFQKSNMGYLLMPAKRPAYRQDRSHDEFLCSLSDQGFVSPDDLIARLEQELVKRFYTAVLHKVFVTTTEI